MYTSVPGGTEKLRRLSFNDEELPRRFITSADSRVSPCSSAPRHVMFCFSVFVAALLACVLVTTAEGRAATGEDAASSRAKRAAYDSGCCTSDHELNITVSPAPLNTDHENGHRYLQGTEINVTCRPADQMSPHQQIFILCLSGCNVSSEPSSSVTTLKLSNDMPRGRYWLGCVTADTTCNPASVNVNDMNIKCLFSDCCSPITIKVDYPASHPTDFWCLSYDWSSLTCTWTVDHGTNQTEWTATYWCPSWVGLGIGNNGPIACWEQSKNTENNLACTVKNFLRFQTFQFQLFGFNLFGNVSQNNSVETNLSIVKLPPLEKLDLVKVEGNATVLNVSWTPLPSSNGMETECRLCLNPREACEATDPLVSISASECQSSRVQLKGLHAFTAYKVQVQMRPQGSPYWSDGGVGWATTPEDSFRLPLGPSQSPELTAGGHVTWDCGDKKCLTLYWKSIPPSAQNGNISRYQGVIRLQHDTSVVLENFTRTQQGNSLNTPMGRSDDVTVEVCLSAGTSAGFSLEPSCIVVPGRSAVGVPSAPVQVNVERQSSDGTRTTYLVTWDSSEDVADYVTVFWCRGDSFYPDVSRLECKAEMGWTDMSANVVYHNLTLEEELGTTWYFGVSRTRVNASRGITWNRCIYDYNGVPGRPSLQVSDAKKTEMVVSWGFNICDDKFLKGLPVTYQIFYRRQTEAGLANPSCLGETTLNVTAREGVKQVALRNLDPDATYGVCMRILTARHASNFSDVRVVSLADVGSEDKSSVRIFAGVLAALSVVVLVTAILVIRWKLIQKAKKFLSTTLPKPKDHVTGGGGKAAERCSRSGAEMVTFLMKDSPSPYLSMSNEEEIDDRKVASPVTPVNLTNGYLKAVVEENDSGVESTTFSGTDLNPNPIATQTHSSVGGRELSAYDSLIASEDECCLSAEYCTVRASQHPGGKQIVYGGCHSRAEGRSADGEDTVGKAHLGVKGQQHKHSRKMAEDKVREQSLERGNAFSGWLSAGACAQETEKTSLVHCAPVLVGPAVLPPCGYVLESWCASCDTAKNRLQVDKGVSESLPRVSCDDTDNRPCNTAYVSESDLRIRAAAVSDLGNDTGYVDSIPQNFKAMLNCRAGGCDVHIEQAVFPAPASSSQTHVETRGYIPADDISVHKTIHPSQVGETTEPPSVGETSVCTPKVKGDLTFLAGGFNNQTKERRSRDDQNVGDRTACEAGYVAYDELGDKTSLAAAPRCHKNNLFPETPGLQLLPPSPAETQGKDRQAGNPGRESCTLEGKTVAEQPVDVPENGRYVGRETVEPQAKLSSCLMQGVFRGQQDDSRGERPDKTCWVPSTSSQDKPPTPDCVPVEGTRSLALSSVGVAGDVQLAGLSDSLSGRAGDVQDVTGCEDRGRRDGRADSTLSYVPWTEGAVQMLQF